MPDEMALEHLEDFARAACLRLIGPP